MNSEIIDTNSYQQSTFRDLLNDGRKNKEFTDVQLRIGDKLFDAHRNVLSLYSPVLKAATSDQWSTTKICPISEEYVDSEIVENLLGFLYTGKIKLTPDNAHSVCVAAHYLQISTLVMPSVKYLAKRITFDNVLTLFQFAIDFGLPSLEQECFHFMYSHNKGVLQDSKILELPVENLKRIINYMKFLNTDKDVLTRQNTFAFIVRWTETNLSERLKDLPILLKSIPLDGLPFEFLNQTVSNHPLVKESTSCQQILSDALENCCDRTMKTNQSLILIGSTDPDNEDLITSSMISYSSRMWKDLPDINRVCSFATAVINKRDIVVSGGFINKYDETDKVEMFDWATQTWRELPSMPRPLIGHSMTAHNGHLYVAGGDNCHQYDMEGDDNANTEVLCYSFETQQWKYVKSLNVGIRDGFLFAYKNHLYSVGRSCTIEKYDPAFDTWTIISTLEQSTIFYAAALHKDKIYISGNRGFEVYDIRTNVWSWIPQYTLRGCNKLVSVDGDLLALDCVRAGRVDKRDAKNSIFVLIEGVEEWYIHSEQALKFLPDHALAISPHD